MGQELVDVVPLLWIDGEEVRYQILCSLGDVIPPRREERVLAASHLFGQYADGLVVKGREAAEQSVENTSKCPHVDRFRVPLVLDDLGSGVPNGTAGGNSGILPDNLGETKVGNLDLSNTARANARNKLSFIFLLFIIRVPGLGVTGRNEGGWVE